MLPGAFQSRACQVLGQTGRQGYLGKYLKSQLHEVEKMLNSVYMKELTVEMQIYQKFAAFFNISAHQFALSKIHGPV